ncbi:CgeB family protein [Acidisarcina polymorpha]|nr:glycosyltransferase [Acidisarcina polymorpha]
MKIVFFGLTITSSWGNGHATTYRSLCKALARRGHHIHFVEKDVEWYRNNRDLANPAYCDVILYESWLECAPSLLNLCKDADVVVVGSYYPDAIAATKALLDASESPLLFYDIDTPITLARLRQTGCAEYLTAALIPEYSAYLSFTGGPTLRELEQNFGSPKAVPFFCSVDEDIYRETSTDPVYQCDLSYLGTYASDRQSKLMAMLDKTAADLPKQQFVVAGPQYPEDISWHANVRRIHHVPPSEHPSFYSSSRFTLNLTRSDMVTAGYSPSVRLFEASACGVPIISDSWAGLGELLTPGEEILLPGDSAETASILRDMPEREYRAIGRRARDRVLSEHTSTHRALEFESIVSACR